jgi:hypothetical protein
MVNDGYYMVIIWLMMVNNNLGGVFSPTPQENCWIEVPLG